MHTDINIKKFNIKKHPLVTLTLFSAIFPLVFSHLETIFVFDIFSDIGSYSKEYVLSTPFILSIFSFDFLFFFPVMFLAGLASLFLYKKRQTGGQLAHFLISFVYSFFYVFRLNGSLEGIRQIASVVILCSVFVCIFLMVSFSFAGLFERNTLTKFIVSSLFITLFNFIGQKESFVFFSLDYILCVLLTLLFLHSGKNGLYRYLLSVLFLASWFIFIQWSSDSIDMGSTAQKNIYARPNIILLVADTLRKDHCNAKITPQITSLGKDAVVYKNCSSTSTWTLPGHASIFTGLYPTNHGAHLLEDTRNLGSNKEIYYHLPQQNLTMAEILKKNGYSTYGVVSNHAYTHSTTGIAQGFDYYDDRYNKGFGKNAFAEEMSFLFGGSRIMKASSHVSGFFECRVQYGTKQYRLAEDINKAVIRVLQNRSEEQPFFLFVNYNDAHAPYAPIEKYRKMFPGKIKPRWIMNKEAYGPGKDELMVKKRKLTTEESEHIKAAYLGEVIYLDEQIGLLIKFLKASNLYNNTIIIFTSDHGEFLGEHDLIGHNSGHLYREATDVPLLIKYPKKALGTKGKIIDKRVDATDILPTLLEYLRLKTPENIDGQVLYNTGEKHVISEQYEYAAFVRRYGKRFMGICRSLLDFPYKYISNSLRSDELYDMSSDPNEEKNIIGDKKDISAKMRQWLENWVKKSGKKKSLRKKTKRTNKKETARLKSLGYL